MRRGLERHFIDWWKTVSKDPPPSVDSVLAMGFEAGYVTMGNKVAFELAEEPVDGRFTEMPQHAMSSLADRRLTFLCFHHSVERSKEEGHLVFVFHPSHGMDFEVLQDIVKGESE